MTNIGRGLVCRSLAACTAFAVAGCGGAPESDHEIDTIAEPVATCQAPTFTVKAYAAGDVVQKDAVLYRCKPFPYSGWCGIGGPYEPGVGTYWSDAWEKVGPCGAGTGGTTTPPPPPTPPPPAPPPPAPPPSGGSTGSGACTTWQQGHNYATGDKVFFQGNGYIAEHDNPGYDPTISTWFWDPTTCSSGGSTPPPPPSTGGSGFAAIVSESHFNSMFPGRNSFYTYQGLVDATKSYAGFANIGDATGKKREAAAFLANVAHETGNLVYIEEIVKGDYCAPSAGCPCAPGKRYYGRGPIQLSWNYNYCSAGAALNLNLQADPDLVARSATVAWQTGLWFWMTQTGAGRMTAHSGIVGGAFGETIRTINGGLECNGANPGQVQSRIDSYRRFCQILGVDPGGNLGC